MLGNRTNRTIGILCAITAGALVLYVGLRFMSPNPAGNNSAPGEMTQPRTSDSQHEALMLADALKKKPQHTPVLLRMAQLAEQAGKHSEAAERLREILRSEPDNLDAKLELGRALFGLGDVQGALEQTTSILQSRADHADALYHLGAIYANLGDSSAARRNWERLLATSPQSEIARQAQRLMAQLPRNKGAEHLAGGGSTVVASQ